MSNQSISQESALYNKTYECPVCFHTFTSKAVKINVNKVLSVDQDLYARYTVVNPLLYDAILCPNCSYCSLSTTFDKILPTQAKWIKEQVTPYYKKRAFHDYTSLTEAITKHQLALLCSMIKKSRIGEQSYIALHIAWLYRDLMNEQMEITFLTRAMEGFEQALEKENFPIFNLNAETTSYIIAAIAYHLKKYDVCRSYLASVILSARGQLKERALDLKTLVNAQKATD